MALTRDDEVFLKAAHELSLLTRPQASECARAALERRARGELGDLAAIAVERGYMNEAGRRAMLSALGAGSPFSSAAAGLDADADDLIEGFEIVERIGEGAIATVYKARSLATETEVALKVLSPARKDDEAFLARFLREAKFGARIAHPNVVAALDTGVSRGRHYIVLELVRGLDLARLIARDGPLPERRALEVARDAARALGAMQAQGLVHRDVKPENLIEHLDRSVKLCDLGLVRDAAEPDAQVTEVGKTVGTPHFFSPEQARGEEVDVRSDLYSLGITLHFLVTGELPFNAPSPVEVARLQLEAAPPPARAKRPELSAGFEELLLRLLEKDRARRPATPADVELAVERLLAGEPPFPPAPAAPPVAGPAVAPPPEAAPPAPARPARPRGRRLPRPDITRGNVISFGFGFATAAILALIFFLALRSC